jgi:hypothetical protein
MKYAVHMGSGATVYIHFRRFEVVLGGGFTETNSMVVP